MGRVKRDVTDNRITEKPVLDSEGNIKRYETVFNRDPIITCDELRKFYLRSQETSNLFNRRIFLINTHIGLSYPIKHVDQIKAISIEVSGQEISILAVSGFTVGIG